MPQAGHQRLSCMSVRRTKKKTRRLSFEHSYLIVKCSQPDSFEERANSALSHFISAQKIDQRFGGPGLVCSSCRNRCLNRSASSSSRNSSLSGLSSYPFSIASSTPWAKNLELTVRKT